MADAFRYIELDIRRKELIDMRPEDDPEIEDIEAEMGRIWQTLSDTQRRRIGHLGSAINRMIRLAKGDPA